jgi:hypothetical protein
MVTFVQCFSTLRPSSKFIHCDAAALVRAPSAEKKRKPAYIKAPQHTSTHKNTPTHTTTHQQHTTNTPPSHQNTPETPNTSQQTTTHVNISTTIITHHNSPKIMKTQPKHTNTHHNTHNTHTITQQNTQNTPQQTTTHFLGRSAF